MESRQRGSEAEVEMMVCRQGGKEAEAEMMIDEDNVKSEDTAPETAEQESVEA